MKLPPAIGLVVPIIVAAQKNVIIDTDLFSDVE
jgi:hypothetical protein